MHLHNDRIWVLAMANIPYDLHIRPEVRSVSRRLPGCLRNWTTGSSTCAQLQDFGLKLPIIGKTLQFLRGNHHRNGQAMAHLHNFEIGMDAADQLLIQFKLENVLNFCQVKYLWMTSGIKSKAMPIEELHHRWVTAVIIYIYVYLWLFVLPGGADCRDDSKCRLIYFLPTHWHIKFAVLLRKCCP